MKVPFDLLYNIERLLLLVKRFEYSGYFLLMNEYHLLLELKWI